MTLEEILQERARAEQPEWVDEVIKENEKSLRTTSVIPPYFLSEGERLRALVFEGCVDF